MAYKDYYNTLGVSKNASQNDIQKAYRELARKHHPDVNKAKGSEDKFKEINEAFEVLKDEKKRALFDKHGSTWRDVSEGRGGHNARDIYQDFSGFGGFQGGGFSGQASDFDIGSIFEQFFTGGGQGQRRQQRAHQRPQQHAQQRERHDQTVRFELTVLEAQFGGKKDVLLRDSSGQERKGEVNIPKGIVPKKKLRIADFFPATGSSAGGDLYLEIDIVSNDTYKYIDGAVHSVLKLAPFEAALGKETEVDTLDGRIKLKIPPCSSSGRSIRVPKKGFLPMPQKNIPSERGDFFVDIQISFPTDLSAKEKELYEALKTAATE